MAQEIKTVQDSEYLAAREDVVKRCLTVSRQKNIFMTSRSFSRYSAIRRESEYYMPFLKANLCVGDMAQLLGITASRL